MKTLSLKSLFVFIVFLCPVLACFSQPYDVRFTHISVKEGLSQNTVYSIHQDHKGFMWFGTQNSGLNRFDGNSFKVYRHVAGDSTSITSDDISDIKEAEDGKLWLGTWGGGVSVFDPVTETFKSYTFDPLDPGSLPNNKSQTLFIDKDKAIWVGTAGGGLCRYNPEKDNFIIYQHNPYDPFTISNNRIWSVAEDTHGYLWIGTDNGLNRFDKNTHQFKRYLPDPGDPRSLSHREVRNVYIDRSGVLWVGTSLSLDEYHPETDNFTHYEPYPEPDRKLYSREINKIHEDFNGVFWVGTQMGGLCIFDRETKNWLKYTHDPKNSASLSYNDVRDIYEDHSHNLWISTRGGGLNKMDLKPQKFKLYKKDPYNQNSLSGNRVRSIIEDKKGIIWIATDGAGLNRYDPEKNEYLHFQYDPYDQNSINRGAIQELHEDKNGNIWIGFDISGVDVLNTKNFTFKHIEYSKHHENSLSDKRVNAICSDKDGIIWLGTKNGLNSYNPENGKIRHFFHNPYDSTSIINNNIFKLICDSEGLIWTGTEYGLTLFDPTLKKAIKNFLNNPDDTLSLSSDNINNIYEDSQGTIWIGTTKGLNKYNDETNTFTAYTIKDGLPTDDIYGILDDDKGHLWLSSFRGISVFDPESKFIRSFDIFDGLQNNMFSTKAALKSSNGEFFFGGIDGFNSFFPEKVMVNPHAPNLVFTDFQIFNKSIKPGKNAVLENSITYTKNIRLNYKQSVFSIWYSALEYTIPEKNQYAYKLVGFDDDWNDVGNRRFANYTNLDAGEYVFMVKASNNDNVWNSEGISLNITITPPFWKTKWFIILMFLVAIFGIYIFIRIREQNLRKYSRILEERVKIRTREIEQQKEEILSQSEELKKLSVVASETDNAVILANEKGTIEWVNEGFTRLLEYELPEFIEQRGSNLFKTSSNREIDKVRNKCKEHKISVSYVSNTRTKSGKELWLQTTLTPILDNDENIEKYVAIDSDITKIKQAEEEIMARNELITEQRDQILKQNNEIVSSILYASRIQKASLPPDEEMDRILKEYFVFNKPRDIVSGDFYWIHQIKDDLILTVSDCTGHGVPGALMSMLSVSFLNKIVKEKSIIEPNDILDRLKVNTIAALHQTGGEFESNDGMDIALIKYNLKSHRLSFSGAMNSMIYIRNNKLYEIKGDRMSIGYHEDKDRKFSIKHQEMKKGDMLYLFSDGYPDQFGGNEGMRFLKKNFKNLLLDIHQHPIQKQKEKLESTLLAWKGKNKQIDDILVLGVRL